MTFDEHVKSDDALFHYTKLSTAIDHILHTKRFKLSILKDTNDPREYKLKIRNSFGSVLSEKAPTYEELERKANAKIDRIYRYESRVMCFCSNTKPTLILSNGNSLEDEHALSNGWNKSRMWSQYGQDHYGVCLVFSKKELERILSETQVQSEIYYKADYVKYMQKENKPLEININNVREKGVEKYALCYIKGNAEELFFRKYIDYRDESEYRIVVIDPENRLEYIDIDTSLRAVIVGDRIPKKCLPSICQKCKSMHIECRRAHWSTTTPLMVLTTC